MSKQPVLIDGEWRDSAGTETFQPVNPATEETFAEAYPVSPWPEIETAIEAAHRAFHEVKDWPGERFAAFLEAFASAIEKRTDALVDLCIGKPRLPSRRGSKTANCRGRRTSFGRRQAPRERVPGPARRSTPKRTSIPCSARWGRWSSWGRTIFRSHSIAPAAEISRRRWRRGIRRSPRGIRRIPARQNSSRKPPTKPRPPRTCPPASCS